MKLKLHAQFGNLEYQTILFLTWGTEIGKIGKEYCGTSWWLVIEGWFWFCFWCFSCCCCFLFVLFLNKSRATSWLNFRSIPGWSGTCPEAGENEVLRLVVLSSGGEITFSESHQFCMPMSSASGLNVPGFLSFKDYWSKSHWSGTQ